MKLIQTPIEGCYEILPFHLKDHRGRFVKPYHRADFKEAGLDFVLAEEFYSVSKKGVLRGMHFQTPPKDTVKGVICLAGSIFDVVVDLRVDSPTYKQHFSIELSEEKGNMLYIPKGLAHGFCTLSKEATVLYMCSEVYSPEHDTGINWKSVGVIWPEENPIVSDKDNELMGLDQFKSTFKL